MQRVAGTAGSPEAAAGPQAAAGATPGETEPYLSLAITAFNEMVRLPPSLDLALPFLDAQGYAYEVVINDDGSTDSTAEIVRDFMRRYPGRVRLVQAPTNQGKGAGVRRAILATTGRNVLFSDADFSTPITELPRLLATLDQGYDIAIGSRIQPDGTDMRAHASGGQPLYRRLFGKLFHRLADPLVVQGVKDTQSGFKLFRGPVARELFGETHLTSIIFDVEVLHLAQRRRYRIAEVPVQWTNAGGSRMRVTAGHAGRVLFDLLRVPWLHRGAGARVPAMQPTSPVGRDHL